MAWVDMIMIETSERVSVEGEAPSGFAGGGGDASPVSGKAG